MQIYFVNFSFLLFLKLYLRDKKKYFSFRVNYFYIDSGSKLNNYLIIVLKKVGFKIYKLNFNMIDIRDKNGELIRLRLPRKDTFNFYEKVKGGQKYKSIIKNIDPNSKINSYIEKGLLSGNISDRRSDINLLFIFEVINSHLKKNRTKKGILYLQKRPWEKELSETAFKLNIEIVTYKKFRDIFKILYNLKNLNFFYLLLKYIKYKRFFFERKNKNYKISPNLFFIGRGHLNFKKNGNNSDFSWVINSDFKKSDINYVYKNKKERTFLEENEINPIDESPKFFDIFKIIKKNKFIKPKQGASQENHLLKNLENQFYTQVSYWNSFFRKHNTKIFLNWYKYDNTHIAQNKAIESLGGVSAIWNFAYPGYLDFETRTDVDVLFSYSRSFIEYEKKLQSKYKQLIITGVQAPILNSNSLESSIKIRNAIKANGAEFIVSVFDENSTDDSRWQTGHDLQRENYKFIIEELLSNKKLGVIFKPKLAKNLYERLGSEVSNLINKAILTGRCFIFEESGRLHTSSTVSTAVNASDISIHCHFCAAASGYEAALIGKPAIYLDREKTISSTLNILPRGEVVFNSWQEILLFLKDENLSNIISNNLSHWVPFLDIVDPFKDGKGANRIGFYLEAILQGYKKGLEREDALNNAADIYSSKWGLDKIYIRNND